MKIGNVKLSNNVVLGPMAGITDFVYRKICKEMGCGLVYTEMVSAKGLYYNDKKTKELMKTAKSEKPLSLQLFGSDPDIIGRVIYNLNDFAAEIFDLNMGCPAPKIVKNGDGSALMNNPALICDIIKSAVKESIKPVTIKIRKGWNDDSINAVEIAKIAEDSGASAVCVHGRTKEQYYKGKADWEIIKKVKENISIPVIGNGDVFSPIEAKNMLKYTNCDAIMIGRGCQGNPWLVKNIINYLNLGLETGEITVNEKKKMIIRHLNEMIEEYGEESGVRQMRKHIAWYIKGIKNATKIKDKIFRTMDKEEIIDLVEEVG